MAVTAQIDDAWNKDEQTWEDWRKYGVEAEGQVWIVKKDGTLNKGQIESLCRHCGWDGSMVALATSQWAPSKCAFLVTKDEYEGKVRFRIAFINDHDRVPGQIGNVDENKSKELQSRFGAELRAIAGSVKAKSMPAGPHNQPMNTMPPPPRQNQASAYAAPATIRFGMTTGKAWAAYKLTQGDLVTEQQMKDSFLEACQTYFGMPFDHKQISQSQWAQFVHDKFTKEVIDDSFFQSLLTGNSNEVPPF